jgi:hypothetical protein
MRRTLKICLLYLSTGITSPPASPVGRRRGRRARVHAARPRPRAAGRGAAGRAARLSPGAGLPLRDNPKSNRAQ